MLAPVLFAALLPAAAAASTWDDVVLWPEDQRAFLQDGPGLLLGEDDRAELMALDAGARAAWIAAFLEHGQDPQAPVSGLPEAIAARKALVDEEGFSPGDVRAELLFLHGRPLQRTAIECSTTYRPLELWTYRTPGGEQTLVLFRPAPSRPFRLWTRWEGKSTLYTEEMAYFLEQYHEVRPHRPRSRLRFDRQLCPQVELVDAATGLEGLAGEREELPDPRVHRALLDPPGDLAAWVAAALAGPQPAEAAPPPRLAVESLDIDFPQRDGGLLVARFLLTMPADAPLEVVAAGTAETAPQPAVPESSAGVVLRVREGLAVPELEAVEEPSPEPVPAGATSTRDELRVAVEGILEREGAVFERFHLRFRIPADAQEADRPLALEFHWPLRPDSSFVLRLQLRDEGGSARGSVVRGFRVPLQVTPRAAGLTGASGAPALPEELPQERLAGADDLRVVPPADEVILTHWRAEALVSGSRIQRVDFYVDGQLQMRRTAAPFSADLKLADFPQEMVVRAEGLDAAGRVVAADEVVLNQPRGAFRVRVLEPARGAAAPADGEEIPVTAEVVVPEGRRVQRVEFRVADEVRATRASPPWKAVVRVPRSDSEELVYVAVVAHLDDGSQTEDLRILDAAGGVAGLDVDLVELYTTVVDRRGAYVRDLPEGAFRVREDGRPQEILHFAEVENLPLTLGVAVDVSGSMGTSLPLAVTAVSEFLESILAPHDTCFLLSFADWVRLEMAPTDDPVALERSLAGLVAAGNTALYDAVVSSLYNFRAQRGRRALVLLSDGEDSASRYRFEDMLEYARRSGVTVYTVGLDVRAPNGRGGLRRGARARLEQLAHETGGRSFVIDAAGQLAAVHREIAAELRSQYLIAYASDGGGGEERFREIRVDVEGGDARTIRGYYR